MTELESKFHIEMINIYKTAKKECGYNATRFLQLVNEKGGLNAAKQLINNPKGTEGFAKLYLYKRLDLSVEAHVIKSEYKELFTLVLQFCLARTKVTKNRIIDIGESL